MTHEDIGRFFDRECCAAIEQRPIEGQDADPLSRQLMAALEDAGYTSGTVLEIGSGDGSFSRELVRRGALAVSGLDLSAQSVGYASARASAAGLSERLRYRVADGSSAPLEAHDAVVSQKVFCCFPDPAGLLANTLPVARSVYALALPESRGLVGLIARLAVWTANGWQWVRRDSFRSYIHDIGDIDRRIRAAGFVRRSSRRQLIWRVVAYSRA